MTDPPEDRALERLGSLEQVTGLADTTGGTCGLYGNAVGKLLLPLSSLTGSPLVACVCVVVRGK
jgi:hypothetical protein